MALSTSVDSELYHYCIIRQDIPLGDQFAQCVHAAGESSPGNLPGDTRAVALSARDEQELLKLEQKLIKLGIAHVAIREPDAPFCNQLLAIGIAPCSRAVARKAVSSFALIK